MSDAKSDLRPTGSEAASGALTDALLAEARADHELTMARFALEVAQAERRSARVVAEAALAAAENELGRAEEAARPHTPADEILAQRRREAERAALAEAWRAAHERMGVEAPALPPEDPATSTPLTVEAARAAVEAARQHIGVAEAEAEAATGAATARLQAAEQSLAEARQARALAEQRFVTVTGANAAEAPSG